jgi:hypothetical protein
LTTLLVGATAALAQVDVTSQGKDNKYDRVFKNGIKQAECVFLYEIISVI